MRLPALLRAKVARRIVWLFVLSAVGPVAILGAVSFRAVLGQLEEHSRERLSQLARNAGQAILQQRALVERSLARASQAVGVDPSATFDSTLLAPSIVGAVVEREGTEPIRLFGSGSAPLQLDASDRDALALGSLLLAPSRSDPRRYVAVFPLDATAPDAGVISAEIIGDSIWAAAETFVSLPTVSDFCVLPGRPGHYYCSSGSDVLPTAFKHTSSPSLRGTFRQADGNGERLVGYWSFHLDRSFERAPWTVLVAEPYAAVYGPVAGFSRTFGLAMALAVLMVVLLSSIQIRRTMQPLEALAAGTRSLADGDLRARVTVSTEDEFASLASSFNSMAERLQAQFTQAAAIHAIEQAALGGFDRDEVLLTALRQLPEVSPCRSAAILSLPAGEGVPELKWLAGPAALAGTAVPLEPAEVAQLAGRAHGVTAVHESSALLAAARTALGPGVLYASPHVTKGQLRGATVLEIPEDVPELDDAAKARVRQLSDQLAIALDDIRLVAELEDLSWGALVALARAIDAKSEWTAGHSERVTEMAMGIGREMRFREDELEVLQRGSLLHDVGKIGIPNTLLDKEGSLTEEESAIIREHPSIGVRILAPIKAFAPVLPLVRHHHETWDGNGYPDGLRGGETPPLVRVLAVADAFDAMASARPYRPGRPGGEVLEEIVAKSGSQFDPSVVQALVRYMESRGAKPLEEVAHAAV